MEQCCSSINTPPLETSVNNNKSPNTSGLLNKSNLPGYQQNDLVHGGKFDGKKTDNN